MGVSDRPRVSAPAPARQVRYRFGRVERAVLERWPVEWTDYEATVDRVARELGLPRPDVAAICERLIPAHLGELEAAVLESEPARVPIRARELRSVLELWPIAWAEYGEVMKRIGELEAIAFPRLSGHVAELLRIEAIECERITPVTSDEAPRYRTRRTVARAYGH
jgi:hypothetical protein